MKLVSNNTEILVKELGMGVSRYNTNIEFNDEDALLVCVMNLLLMEKGTFPDIPDMGFGIRERRHFILSGTNISDMNVELNEQIRKYINSTSITSASVSARRLQTGDETVDVTIVMDTNERIVFSDDNNDITISTSDTGMKDFDK